MPDTDIERVIFKLELDGSSYIKGADSLSDSTKKLTAAQEKAKAKLAELQKSHNTYKKSLDETNAILKANEKETIELTKQLNALKDAEKGTSAEATRLKAELRGIALNTKEFRSEAKELTSNLANTTNQIKIQTKEIESGVKANGNFAGSLTKAYSGLRTLANIIPGIGIGGLVALIAGPAVEAFQNWFESINQASGAMKLLKENQENLNEVMANADKDAGKQITDLKILYETATNVNVSMDDRLKAVRALQTEFPEYFKNVKAETILNGEAADKYKELAAAILATARATAAKTKLDELEARQLDKDFERQKVINATNRELAAAAKAGATAITTTGGGIGGTGSTSIQVSQEENRRNLAKAVTDRRNARLAQIDEDKKDLQAQEDFLIKFAGLTNLAKVVEDDNKGKGKPKVEAQRKEIENIYEQELQKLRADIAKLDEKGFTTEATITKAIEEDFKKRSDAFVKAQEKGQLTPEQLTSLNKNLSDLQTLTLNQNLKSFREQKAAYLAQIENELNSLQIEESAKRISTIQDRFERERAIIISETDKTVNILKDKRDKLITDITKNAAKNGLTAADIAPQIQSIKDTYSNLLNDLEVIKNQKLQQLSFDTFEKLSEDARRLLDSGNLGVSQGSLINIKEQTALFLAGKISYKEYQKQLTEIAKFELNERFSLQKLFLEAEIKIRQDKLLNDKSLTDEQIQRLEDEITKLKQQLTDADKANVIAGTKGSGSKEFDEKIASFVKYTQAIGDLAGQVISFWQLANQAEAAALDRSIALQEKRVSAAQKIADRGNAQYLKQEEDRLTQLNVQKENAARKQLGINAALQGSEILVALISGLAQGAKIGGGLGAIASVAAIVAAIAGAFAIAQSLRPPQFSFFRGTKDTGQGGREDSKGGFTATLHPNEAVIPSNQNKAYRPTVAAIYDGTIPAEHLNNFVKNYHTIKMVPQPNYSRIKQAAELHIGNDGRMAVLLEENNNLQRQTIKVLHKMGVSVSLDQNGFAVTQMEVIKQIERDKKA